MPIPAPLTRALALLWLALGVAASADAAWMEIWVAGGILLALALLVDLALAHRIGCPIEAERECPKAWPVGVAQEVALVLRRTTRSLRLAGTLFDHVPAQMWYENLPGSFNLQHDEERIVYRAVATTRGPLRFGALELRLETPLRLWQWRHRLGGGEGQTDVIRVYPDFARIAHYALMATDNRLSQIGLLLRRRRGEGLEFHQLREYRDGDTPRQIDWKATARHGKLIAREYQDERNQQIVFLLDCSQRMNTREEAEVPLHMAAGARAIGELSHFDHALNAMLLLSYVALRQGDGVGFSTFAHPVPRHVPVRRSLAALNSLMESVYDLEPTPLVPDYQLLVNDVPRQIRKRSLVVLISNLRDEDGQALEAALARISRRHVVVVASLREPGVARSLDEPVRDFSGALRYSAAAEYLLARQHSARRLRSHGVDCLEVTPAQLPITLVNHYWHVKRSGIL